ncbi:MAG: hypothetical protein KTR31_18740 [Myxococcales bacterium]|nr:hypothetical protein [Myxococcales bacterium]
MQPVSEAGGLVRWICCVVVWGCAGGTSEPHPSTSSVPDPVDADGDGVTSDADCDDASPDVWSDCDACVDADGDGAYVGCQAYVTRPQDCDDTEATVAPGLAEVCDALDNDCDGGVDEGVLQTFGVDADGDGYTTDVLACSDPDGDHGEPGGDCDDLDATRHPGAPELCDGRDNDCAAGPAELLVPQDHATIQGAVDAARSGDSVCVDDGTYAERLVIDKPLHLEGTGSDRVVVDAEGKGRVVLLDAGAIDNTVMGLTLQNGFASAGGGLHVADAKAQVELVDVEVEDNLCTSAPCQGVGLFLRGDVQLDGVGVRGNRATLASDGNVVGVGMHVAGGTLVGHDVVFDDNVGTTNGSIWIEGGGFYATGADVELYDVTVSDNHLVGGQTRAHAFGVYQGSVLLERAWIHANTAEGDTWPYPAKGAIQLGSDATLRNVLITDNHSAGHDKGTILGTVLTTFGASTIRVEHSTIAYNTSDSAWSSLLDANGDDVTFSHVIAYDNDGSSTVRNNTGTTTFEYSLVGSSGVLHSSITSDKTNLAEVDPRFVDSAKGDYGLDKGSPAIDAGDPKVLDVDGTTADLGVYGGPAAP